MYATMALCVCFVLMDDAAAENQKLDRKVQEARNTARRLRLNTIGRDMRVAAELNRSSSRPHVRRVARTRAFNPRPLRGRHGKHNSAFVNMLIGLRAESLKTLQNGCF